MKLQSDAMKNIPSVEITPEMAKLWLNTSKGNRKIKETNMVALVETMRRGEWEHNGETIKFDCDGHLVDGHHRLYAVILANVSIVSSVLLGCNSSVIKTYDTGVSRSARDQRAFIGGEMNETARDGYLKMCALLLTGRHIALRDLGSVDRWTPFFRPGIDWSIKNIRACGSIGNAPISGAIAFAYHANPKGIAEFGIALASGEALGNGSPALTLRNLLLGRIGREAGVHGKKEGRFLVARKVLNAALAYLEGRKIHNVQDGERGLEFFRLAYARNKDLQTLAEPWRVGVDVSKLHELLS